MAAQHLPRYLGGLAVDKRRTRSNERRRTVMSPSGWSWYWCLVSKIIVSLKNSFTTVCNWQKWTFVACRHRSEIWFHCLDIHLKLSQTLQLSTLQLNLLFSKAVHFAINLQLWHLKRASYPVKCFWCDCEKGYIYPSRRDVVRRSRKFDKCRANQFRPLLQMHLMPKTQIFFHFQFDGSTTVFYF